MTSQKPHISLSKIEEEYQTNIFEDDERMYELKQIIFNKLDDLDRAVLILYTDEGSMAKAGKKFNVSAATIYQRMKNIRQIIKDNL